MQQLTAKRFWDKKHVYKVGGNKMRKLGKVTKRKDFTVQAFASCYCDCDCDCFTVSGSSNISTNTRNRKNSWWNVVYSTNNK